MLEPLEERLRLVYGRPDRTYPPNGAGSLIAELLSEVFCLKLDHGLEPLGFEPPTS